MNTKINFLIVEDSLSFSLELKMIVEEIGYSVIGQAENSGKALEIIFSKKPDIILMDININGDMTGTEIAKHIKHLDIPIIFITSYDDQNNFDNAKVSNMYGYLIKPVSKFTLQSTIETTIKNWNESLLDVSNLSEGEFYKENIFVKKDKLFFRVKISDIQCIEATGKSTFLYINKDRLISKLSINEITSFLPSNIFIKTHRSFIVNVEYIDSIDINQAQIHLKNGFKILISRQRKPGLMKLINREL